MDSSSQIPDVFAAWSRYVADGELSVLIEEAKTLPEFVEGDVPAEIFLVMALSCHDWDAAAAMLACGASLIPDNSYEDGPLHRALEHNGDCPEIVEWLLAHGAERDRRGINNWTPLHRAASLGFCGVIDCLVKAGTPLDVGTVIDEDDSPLSIAAMCGQLEAVECLARHGVRLTREKTSMLNRTAKEVARRCGHREVMSLLDWLEDEASRPANWKI